MIDTTLLGQSSALPAHPKKPTIMSMSKSSALEWCEKQVVTRSGIHRVGSAVECLIFACTCVCRFVSLLVPLSRILIEFGMPE